MNAGRSIAHIVLLLLMPLWAGAIIGVSLIGTPVKFQAPSLSIPAGLEVGRYTFRFFAGVELCFLIAVALAAMMAHTRRITAVVLALVAIQVLLQRYWLLPLLDDRVSHILAGGEVGFTRSHWVYAAFEVLKPILLVAATAVECCAAL